MGRDENLRGSIEIKMLGRIADVPTNSLLNGVSHERLHPFLPARDVSRQPIGQVVAVLEKGIHRVQVLGRQGWEVILQP